MKFRVCFTLAKYENHMLTLCEITDVFIYQLGSLKLIKTMLKTLNVFKVYLQCGIVIQRVVTNIGYLAFNYHGMKLKIKFALDCIDS